MKMEFGMRKWERGLNSILFLSPINQSTIQLNKVRGAQS